MGLIGRGLILLALVALFAPANAAGAKKRSLKVPPGVALSCRAAAVAGSGWSRCAVRPSAPPATAA
jgi:hypothetical protein